MHPTSFHFGFVETILFKEWHVSNWQGMFGSAIAITILAALYESLKYFREYLNSKSAGSCVRAEKKSKIRNIFNISHVTQTVLVTFQVLLSNVLMLVFMTYNVYLCIALIVGVTIAYFLLFWKPHVARQIIKNDTKTVKLTETNGPAVISGSTEPSEIFTSI